MKEVNIRVYLRNADGVIEDSQTGDWGLENFGGFLPSVGDMVLDPAVLSQRDRSDPGNRRMWTVVQRVFNPKDFEDYVAVIVEERPLSQNEYGLLP